MRPFRCSRSPAPPSWGKRVPAIAQRRASPRRARRSADRRSRRRPAPTARGAEEAARHRVPLRRPGIRVAVRNSAAPVWKRVSRGHGSRAAAGRPAARAHSRRSGSPTRIALTTCSGGRLDTAGVRCQANRTAATAMNDTPFRMKTPPAPIAATSNPPSAGLTACESVSDTELSEIAAGSCSRSTRSTLTAENAGSPRLARMPRTKVAPRRTAGVVTSATVSTPSSVAVTNCQAYANRSSPRRSMTSASAPAGSAKAKAGSAPAVDTSPTKAAELVSDVI
jgi:hypothetical protein